MKFWIPVLLLLFHLKIFAQGDQPFSRTYESGYQWTGIAMTPSNRMFVTFPNWGGPYRFGLGEVQADGTVMAWPNEDQPFECLQSVYYHEGLLYALDSRNPEFKGTLQGGPRLYVLSPLTESIIREYPFSPSSWFEESYFNDVSISPDSRYAYISDSGRAGVIILDLKTGLSHRHLDENKILAADGTPVVIEDQIWSDPDGKPRQVHSNGIAIEPDGKRLLIQALNGSQLFAIPTSILNDRKVAPVRMFRSIRVISRLGPADGIRFGLDEKLYLSHLNRNSITVLDPKTESAQPWITHDAIDWPDSLAFRPLQDGQQEICFTTSRIHEGKHPSEPYRIHCRIAKR